ncbi:hypothetical protein M2474_002131 [Dysgonomonas sp. PH5-37]|nr:hypothetical protein [Dysgonomonas sp. PH5-37]
MKAVDEHTLTAFLLKKIEVTNWELICNLYMW